MTSRKHCFLSSTKGGTVVNLSVVVPEWVLLRPPKILTLQYQTFDKDGKETIIEVEYAQIMKETEETDA